MYNSPKSCLLFLFFIFSLIHPFSCDSSKRDFGLCETLFQCGNITAGLPFWGGSRRKDCGHPLLELRCFNNTTSLFISNQEFNVLHLNQTSNTLRLVRKDHLGSFCSSQFTNTTLPQEIFHLSETYKSHRVFNHCFLDHYLRRIYKCRRGFIILSENPENHHICGATFTVNVPKSFIAGENKFNMTKFESVLSKGFEVKLKIDEITCHLCSSYPERCGINKTLTLGATCRPIHPPLLTATELHKLCSAPFRCGDQTKLLYPFWTSGREDCGHPDFELKCTREHAELNISSVKFRIISANYDSGIIKLARLDSIKDPCPQDSTNMSFEENILPLAPTSDLLTIYYDCKDFSEIVSRLPTYIKDLNCRNEETDDDRKDYYVTRSLSPPLLKDHSAIFNDFRSFCSKNVSTPASKIALNTLESTASTDNLKMALNESFELGVNKDCKMCMDSGGACGYNPTHTTNGFLCYCIDEASNRTCKPTNKGVSNGGLSTPGKAGIGIASGLGILFITGALLLLIRRRRKTQSDQYTSKDLPVTSYSSRETSRTPTSTTISYSSNHSILPSISDLRNGSVSYGVQVFRYEELEEATENFSRELGDGGFGTVYYGMLKDGRAVAVKRLYERSLKRVEQFKNEIDILKSLKHPNLVTLYGCTSRHSRELLLVYEYISNGTLAEHLHGDRAEARSLCWSLRLKVAIETASALSYLHTSGIIHRDIKTTNILLDENYQVKVADFGLSRLFPTDQTHISTAPQGTPGYVDPEYYQCYRLNEKSDVYSFGVVLTELISSKEAVDITRHRHDINLANMAVSKIQNNALHELVDPSLGFEKDPEVKRNMTSVAELAFRCLQQEREVRPSMDEIVEILKGIKDGEKRVLVVESPDVVDIDGNGGKDDVRLLRHSFPPPISPETDKWTSSSDTAASF